MKRITWIVAGLIAGCARRSVETPKRSPVPMPSTATVVASPPAPVRPTEPFTLRDALDRPIEVYPSLTIESRAPLVVVLHATCMQPASVCDWFGSAGRDRGWLVCPSGNSTCYGEPDWNGSGPIKADFLEAAIAKVEAQVAPFLASTPGVLIGWSRGAFAARDILYARPTPTRFRGLVMMAAHVVPDVAKLRAAGIRRVVMASGDYDGSRATMLGAVKAMQSQGLDARFVSLGKIAHVWPEDFEARMREPIAWAAD